MKGVYIFLADGFEEIEALATLDILRRGGVDVKTVSITENGMICGAHGVHVASDMVYSEFETVAEPGSAGEEDCMIFPGGLPGSQYLADKSELMDIMKQHYALGGKVAAICAAPGLVLSQLDGLEGKKFTCYDSFEPAIISKGGEYLRQPSVTDGNFITGRGPGCALEFGLEVLAALKGGDVAQNVRKGMLF